MLTLVPARGGSKRIPRKNLRPLAGIPLLLWTLLPFRHFNPVVSSDDPEILDLARRHGFSVIERPAELATDEASSAAVAHHAMHAADAQSVMLLQPTSPFRSLNTVETAVGLFQTYGMPIAAFKDVDHAYKGGVHIEHIEAPTGSCYIIARKDLKDTFLPEGYQGVTDTIFGAIDIDTEGDWQLAEVVARSRVDKLKELM
jgi:CMP-N-acetylneuraminic acid synthetase